ncbi:class I SAM-dependent methyltransferase [Phyllobacterium sp. LjRoot231]|uniref:class I SAM-dependent methyltransferase n=1 Tax=Phyllobacterium sp. LjRoot231 TaxID=3342289 RepID=UPI003ECF99B4
MSLWQFFLDHQGREIHKWKHYFPAYERHFSRYRHRPVTFVEIGAGHGGSAQMWKKFFGPLATIISVDIREECAGYGEDQVHMRIGNQADPVFLQSILDDFGTPDIVLDDGSHVAEHQRDTFNFLYQKTARDGIYMVEDLHTAYWPDWQGGLKREGTFIEICKDLIDQLHGDYSSDNPITEFTRTTLSMTIYDSIVAFERGSIGRRQAIQIGKKPAA